MLDRYEIEDTIKVSELIEFLKQFDGDVRVFSKNDYGPDIIEKDIIWLTYHEDENYIII